MAREMKKPWFCSQCGSLIHEDYGWTNEWEWYVLHCEKCGNHVVPVRERKNK